MNVVLMCLVAMILGVGSVTAPKTRKASREPASASYVGEDQPLEGEDDGASESQDAVTQRLQESLDKITAYTQQIQQLVDDLAAQVAGNTSATSATLDDLSATVQEAQEDIDDAGHRMDTREEVQSLRSTRR